MNELFESNSKIESGLEPKYLYQRHQKKHAVYAVISGIIAGVLFYSMTPSYIGSSFIRGLLIDNVTFSLFMGFTVAFLNIVLMRASMKWIETKGEIDGVRITIVPHSVIVEHMRIAKEERLLAKMEHKEYIKNHPIKKPTLHEYINMAISLNITAVIILMITFLAWGALSGFRLTFSTPGMRELYSLLVALWFDLILLYVAWDTTYPYIHKVGE
jgi:hypothetical protein